MVKIVNNSKRYYQICAISIVGSKDEDINKNKLTECFLENNSLRISLQDFKASESFSFGLCEACCGVVVPILDINDVILLWNGTKPSISGLLGFFICLPDSRLVDILADFDSNGAL